MTAWKFNPELTIERAGSDWVVLDADAGVVLRASGPAAHVLTAIAATGTATGTVLLPAHVDDTVAALAERGVIVANTNTNTKTDADAHATDINDATTGMSRRRLISTGALAAGAATLATTIGIHTLILPTAASAASSLAAPTGVTATPSASQQITVNWTNVVGATSYKVFYRIFGSPVDTAYTEFVPLSPPITAGPVTVTGLTNTTNYEFYVVAVNATTPSAASTPLATATATQLPVVYAATDGGGLSISTNGGTTFTNRTAGASPGAGLGSNTVRGVFVVGSMVYAATSGGLSVSTNGGASFTNRTTGNGLGNNNVYGVFVEGSTVYAATFGGGLSISTDSGTSFTNRTIANSGLGSNFLSGVFVVGSTVYAATEDNGLSISTDGGATFTNYTTSNGLGSNVVRGVFASGSTVYAATFGGGLSISTNPATTAFTNRTVANNGLGSNFVRGVFVLGSMVYAATEGGLSISDGGTSFTNRTVVNNDLGNNNVYGVFASGAAVYAATNGGLSISTDGGTSFTNRTTANSGLGSNSMRGVFAVPGAS